MTHVIALSVVLAAMWLVSRAAHWLPAYYAREEAAWIAAAQQSQGNDFNPPAVPGIGALWREFFTAMPPFNRFTIIAVVAIALAATSLWLNLPWGWPLAVWFAYVCGLVLLALVDWQTKLLPDMLTIPLLWLGLIVQLFPQTASVGLELAVVGAVLGYVPLWLLAHAYKLIRRRDGMGMGDLKLLAAMGVWSGPAVLPPVVFTAAVLAIIWFLIQRVTRRRSGALHEEHPFGPWIILAYLLIVFTPVSSIF